MKKLLWKDKQVEAWVDNVHIGKSPSTLSTHLEKCQKNSENMSKIDKMETECKMYFVLFFRFAVARQTPKQRWEKRQSLVLVFTSSHFTFTFHYNKVFSCFVFSLCSRLICGKTVGDILLNQPWLNKWGFGQADHIFIWKRQRFVLVETRDLF